MTPHTMLLRVEAVIRAFERVECGMVEERAALRSAMGELHDLRREVKAAIDPRAAQRCAVPGCRCLNPAHVGALRGVPLVVDPEMDENDPIVVCANDPTGGR